MTTRPATTDDLPELAELHAHWEQHFLGAAEMDADEINEFFGRVPLSEQSCVVVEGGRIVGAAWWVGNDAMVFADPDSSAYERLVGWLDSQVGPTVDALRTDEALVATLDSHGWQYEGSAFELIRAVSPDWTLARPSWPTDVTVRDLRPDDAADLHHLIYVDAGWASVRGHAQRAFDEWRAIFLNESTVYDQQVVAVAGDRLVGAALGRIFGDGTGWVAQLAVAREQRGRGLGRALLLEALHRRVAAGATALGLEVQAENVGALELYRGVGLEIDREWLHYARATTAAKG